VHFIHSASIAIDPLCFTAAVVGNFLLMRLFSAYSISVVAIGDLYINYIGKKLHRRLYYHYNFHDTEVWKAVA
jgi:hypothetical protein